MERLWQANADALMARFYFHLFNDMTCIDEEGAECADSAVALKKAAAIAREMAAESVKQGRLVLDHRVEVADANGKTVGVVRFRDAIDIRQSETQAS